MSNAPFYALLAYMLISDFRNSRLTRAGLRTLSEKKPPEPRTRKRQAAAPGQPAEHNGEQPRAVVGQTPWPGRQTG